ncbi:PEP-utilizing enzyme [Amycolatopsis sp. NPDC059657]|uniref:PEP-utilizing enzyme n=1 Tax=Amycolatopsis sp. NPDC059657 TaxID=3346899 RepID=UPI00366BD3BC
MQIEVPPGYWQRDASHLPRPQTPLTRTTCSESVGFDRAAARFGFLLKPVFAEIGGWPYLSLQPVGGKPDAPVPPAWLLPLLIRLSPEARRRMRRCKEVIRTDFSGQLLDQWERELLPGLEKRIADLRDADLTAASDEEVSARLARATDLVAHGMETHFLLNIANWLALSALDKACHELLGWTAAETDELLGGLSVRSTEPARRLAELGDAREGDPEFAEYLRIYGCRALAVETAEPTVGEIPGLTRRLLEDQLTRGYAPEATAKALAERRAEAGARARARLTGAAATRFERVLARAEKAYPVREDNVFFTIDAPIALVRYAALEIGRRLTARRRLDEIDDIFFYHGDEAVTALRDDRDLRESVVRRKEERAWAIANPGPMSYGREPGPPPSLRWMPSYVRVTMEAAAWASERVLATHLSNRAEATETRVLRGVPASAGRYRGTVRVIGSEAEFGKLQAGDVLVCPCTRPSWSVLFPSVGAIVTDTGGSLSHPAIIAREHQIPAVVATHRATTTLHDGQTVLVDGSAGTVELIP